MTESWKDKADKLQAAIKDNPELGVQVVYRSRQGLNDDPVCVPVLISETMKDNQYPDVVTAPPADMVNPKYNWFGDNRGWYENDSTAQGVRITKLENGAKSLNESLAALQKDNNAAVENQKKTDTKIDQVIKLVTSTNLSMARLAAGIQAQKTTPAPTAGESGSQTTAPQTSQPKQGGVN